MAETAQMPEIPVPCSKWMYDPNVTITLPAGKGQELSTLYFQACTDWVWENIDKAKLGVSDKVFFAGWVSGMDGFYASIDINAIE